MGEDCFALVRTFCIEQLDMRSDYVYNMVFGRAHRAGQ